MKRVFLPLIALGFCAGVLAKLPPLSPEAKAKADAERAKIEASLQDKIARAETRIAEIKAKALADVGTIAEETTTALVEQLIGSKATKAEIASAVKSVAGK